MAKIANVTVIYSITLRDVDVPDDADLERKREIIYELAEEHRNSRDVRNNPIIHDCSDDDLID